MYICDLTRASGAGSAMCLNTRGLVRSVIRRIVPPLPAESTPSNTTQTLAPVFLTHSCMVTSSPWRTFIARSYSLRLSFAAGRSFVLTGDADESASCSRSLVLRAFLVLLMSTPPAGSSDPTDDSNARGGKHHADGVNRSFSRCGRGASRFNRRSGCARATSLQGQKGDTAAPEERPEPLAAGARGQAVSRRPA